MGKIFTHFINTCRIFFYINARQFIIVFLDRSHCTVTYILRQHDRLGLLKAVDKHRIADSHDLQRRLLVVLIINQKLRAVRAVTGP